MKLVSLFALSILLVNAAWADADAEIKYRQGVMEAVGGHMASMGAILKGKVHMSDLKLHANALATLTSVVPEIFPEGSGEGKTEALGAIWTDAKGFKEAMDKFVNAAQTMSDAASNEDMAAIGPAISGLGKSCKGCHDNFREENEH